MGISSVLTTVQYSTVQYSTVHSTVQDLGDGEQRKSSVLTTGSGLMLPLIFSPHRTSDTTQHSAHNRSYGHLLWQSSLGLNCHLYSVYRHFDSRYYFHTMHLFNLPEMLQSIILSFIFFIVKCFSILPYFICCVELGHLYDWKVQCPPATNISSIDVTFDIWYFLSEWFCSFHFCTFHKMHLISFWKGPHIELVSAVNAVRTMQYAERKVLHYCTPKNSE